MKEIQKNLDNLFLKAGQFNRYQFIIVALFSIQFLCSQFFHVNFIYLTANPLINFNGISIKADANFCDNFYDENNSKNQINKDEQIPTTSIIVDLDLTCQRLKINLIYIIYYSANILGSCLSYHFYEKIGSKISLIITAGIQTICLFLLEILEVGPIGLIFLYIDIFFIGFNEYVVANLLFLYICDIINFEQIPLFITIITCGRGFASLLGILFFRYIKFNWKHDLCIIAGIDVLILIIIFFYMVNSPKAALRNNKYMNFIRNLLNLAKKNEKQLEKEDFDFLIRFMSNKEKEDYHRFFASFSENKISNDNVENYPPDSDKNDDDDEEIDKGLLLKEDELQRKKTIKDDYLMSDENNKVGSVQILLFHEIKMEDYSVFDLFKFQNHLINFFIVSYLWAVYNFIKHGLQSTLNRDPEYYTHNYWIIIIEVFGLINLFVIMFLYLKTQKSFHHLIISIEILTLITLLICCYLDDDHLDKIYYIIFLLVGKIIWNSLYLLLIIMSLLFYPIMLRSKGLGWNFAIGVSGKLIVALIIEPRTTNEYFLYFLVFNFLALVFSNSLPKRIGSLLIDLTQDEEANKVMDKILKESEDLSDMHSSGKNSRISLMSIITT